MLFSIDPERNSVKKHFLRTIALITFLTFSFEQVFFSPNAAAFTGNSQASSEIRTYSGFQIQIPSDLGTVEAVYSGAGPSLIHLEEAHGNLEGQKKIESLLHYLSEEYGFNTLFLEGSAYELHPELAQFYPQNPKLNRKILEALAEKGIASGPELFLASKDNAQGLGIEDTAPYVQNSRAFVQVKKAEARASRFVASLETSFRGLSGSLANRNLKSFLDRAAAYDAGNLSVSDWIRILNEESQKVLQLDLNDAQNQADWPMLLRLNKLLEFESRLDLTALEKEKKMFQKALGRTPKEIREQVQKLLSSGLNQSELPDPETGILFERMVSSLPRNFAYQDFPNVNRLIGHLILQSELKTKILSLEIDRLKNQIAESLAKTPQEKKLLSLLGRYQKLSKLLHLELSPSEYETIKSRLDSFQPSKLVSAIAELARSEKIREVPTAGKSELDVLFQKALEFYDLAHERDQIMLKNIEKKLHEQGVKKAVILTGGFHSETFSDYFHSKGYSYALVTPRMLSAPQSNAPYSENMVRLFKEPDQVQASGLHDAYRVLSRDSDLASLGRDPILNRSEIRTVRDLVLRSELRGSDASPTPKVKTDPETIFHVAYEMAPFFGVGGVKDVTRGLLPAIARAGKNANIILPAHPSIFKSGIPIEKIEGEVIRVPFLIENVVQRQFEFQVYRASIEGVTVYFLHNPDFFQKGYGADDPFKEYAVFSRAAAELAIQKGADVVHAHDYQAALTLIFLRSVYYHQSQNLATVYTIHNLGGAYQGRYGMQYKKETLLHMGVPQAAFDPMGALEFNNGINLAKGGIIYADKVTVVSPQYRNETLTSEFGEGLDGVLREKAGKGDYVGILNGLDTKVWSPEHDTVIAEPYSDLSFDRKVLNREPFIRDHAPGLDPNAFWLSFIGRFTPQKGIDLIIEALPELVRELGIEFIFLGTGDKGYAEKIQTVLGTSSTHPGVLFNLFDEKIARRILSVSTSVIVPSLFEPCGLVQGQGLRYGALPIVRRVGGLDNTVADLTQYPDIGNGFVFRDATAGALKEAVRRAVHLFHHQPDFFKRAAVRGMGTFGGWEDRVPAFLEIYQDAWNRYNPRSEMRQASVDQKGISRSELKSGRKKNPLLRALYFSFVPQMAAGLVTWFSLYQKMADEFQLYSQFPLRAAPEITIVAVSTGMFLILTGLGIGASHFLSGIRFKSRAQIRLLVNLALYAAAWFLFVEYHFRHVPSSYLWSLFPSILSFAFQWSHIRGDNGSSNAKSMLALRSGRSELRASPAETESVLGVSQDFEAFWQILDRIKVLTKILDSKKFKTLSAANRASYIQTAQTIVDVFENLLHGIREQGMADSQMVGESLRPLADLTPPENFPIEIPLLSKILTEWASKGNSSAEFEEFILRAGMLFGQINSLMAAVRQRLRSPLRIISRVGIFVVSLSAFLVFIKLVFAPIPLSLFLIFALMYEYWGRSTAEFDKKYSQFCEDFAEAMRVLKNEIFEVHPNAFIAASIRMIQGEGFDVLNLEELKATPELTTFRISHHPERRVSVPEKAGMIRAVSKLIRENLGREVIFADSTGASRAELRNKQDEAVNKAVDVFKQHGANVLSVKLAEQGTPRLFLTVSSIPSGEDTAWEMEATRILGAVGLTLFLRQEKEGSAPLRSELRANPPSGSEFKNTTLVSSNAIQVAGDQESIHMTNPHQIWLPWVIFALLVWAARSHKSDASRSSVRKDRPELRQEVSVWEYAGIVLKIILMPVLIMTPILFSVLFVSSFAYIFAPGNLSPDSAFFNILRLISFFSAPLVMRFIFLIDVIDRKVMDLGWVSELTAAIASMSFTTMLLMPETERSTGFFLTLGILVPLYMFLSGFTAWEKLNEVTASKTKDKKNQTSPREIEIPSQEKLLQEVAVSDLVRKEHLLTIHERMFGKEAEIETRAPGRANLIGEHVDYPSYPDDGSAVNYSLPFSLQMNVLVTGSKRNDSILKLWSETYQQSFQITLDEIIEIGRAINHEPKELQAEERQKLLNEKNVPAWAVYPIGLYFSLIEEGKKLSGAELAIEGNVPLSGGMSSSAALTVALTLALNGLFDLGITEVSDFAKTARSAEVNPIVGSQCGLLDQTASLTGSEGAAVLINYGNMKELKQIPLKMGDYAIIVVDSSFPRTLAATRYNERVQELSEVPTIMNHFLSLRHPEFISKSHVSAFTWDEFQEIAADFERDDEVLFKRARHVLSERDRTLRFADALSAGDIPLAGKILTETGQSLSMKGDFEISGSVQSLPNGVNNALDLLVEAGLKAGKGSVYGRMMGGGGGGSAVFLVPWKKIADWEKEVGDVYQQVTGLTAKFFVALPSQGARVIKSKQARSELRLQSAASHGKEAGNLAAFEHRLREMGVSQARLAELLDAEFRKASRYKTKDQWEWLIADSIPGSPLVLLRNKSDSSFSVFYHGTKTAKGEWVRKNGNYLPVSSVFDFEILYRDSESPYVVLLFSPGLNQAYPLRVFDVSEATWQPQRFDLSRLKQLPEAEAISVGTEIVSGVAEQNSGGKLWKLAGGILHLHTAKSLFPGALKAGLEFTIDLNQKNDSGQFVAVLSQSRPAQVHPATRALVRAELRSSGSAVTETSEDKFRSAIVVFSPDLRVRLRKIVQSPWLFDWMKHLLVVWSVEGSAPARRHLQNLDLIEKSGAGSQLIPAIRKYPVLNIGSVPEGMLQVKRPRGSILLNAIRAEIEKERNQIVSVGLPIVDTIIPIQTSEIEKIRQSFPDLHPGSLILATNVQFDDFLRNNLDLAKRGVLKMGGSLSTSRVLNQIGVNPSVFGYVGRDAENFFILKTLSGSGIPYMGLGLTNAPTSRTLVFTEPDGRRTFVHVIGANEKLSSFDFQSLVTRFKAVSHSILHIGYEALSTPDYLEYLADEITALKAQVPQLRVVLDTVADFRGLWTEVRRDHEEIFQKFMRAIDVFCTNLSEGSNIAGLKPLREGANFNEKRQRFMDITGKLARFLRPEALLIIKGDDYGSYAWSQDFRDPGELGPQLRADLFRALNWNIVMRHAYAGLSIKNQVDGTGAGDAFVAGVIEGLRRGLSLEKIMAYGTVLGGLAVGQIGGGNIGERNVSAIDFMVETYLRERRQLPDVPRSEVRREAPQPSHIWKGLVQAYQDRTKMGEAVAFDVLQKIRDLFDKEHLEHVVWNLAAAPSQRDLWRALINQMQEDKDYWAEKLRAKKIIFIHMDEFIGRDKNGNLIDENHEASFRGMLLKEFLTPLTQALDLQVPDLDWHPLGKLTETELHSIEGAWPQDAAFRNLVAEAAERDLKEMVHRYGAIHISTGGAGENAHWAFNDPPYANFNDDHWVKPVRVSDSAANVAQQVAAYPNSFKPGMEMWAVTQTMKVAKLVWYHFQTVPDAAKSDALYRSLTAAKPDANVPFSLFPFWNQPEKLAEAGIHDSQIKGVKVYTNEVAVRAAALREFIEDLDASKEEDVRFAVRLNDVIQQSVMLGSSQEGRKYHPSVGEEKSKLRSARSSWSWAKAHKQDSLEQAKVLMLSLKAIIRTDSYVTGDDLDKHLGEFWGDPWSIYEIALRNQLIEWGSDQRLHIKEATAPRSELRKEAGVEGRIDILAENRSELRQDSKLRREVRSVALNTGDDLRAFLRVLQTEKNSGRLFGFVWSNQPDIDHLLAVLYLGGAKNFEDCRPYEWSRDKKIHLGSAEIMLEPAQWQLIIDILIILRLGTDNGGFLDDFRERDFLWHVHNGDPSMRVTAEDSAQSAFRRWVTTVVDSSSPGQFNFYGDMPTANFYMDTASITGNSTAIENWYLKLYRETLGSQKPLSAVDFGVAAGRFIPDLNRDLDRVLALGQYLGLLRVTESGGFYNYRVEVTWNVEQMNQIARRQASVAAVVSSSPTSAHLPAAPVAGVSGSSRPAVTVPAPEKPKFIEIKQGRGHLILKRPGEDRERRFTIVSPDNKKVGEVIRALPAAITDFKFRQSSMMGLSELLVTVSDGSQWKVTPEGTVERLEIRMTKELPTADLEDLDPRNKVFIRRHFETPGRPHFDPLRLLEPSSAFLEDPGFPLQRRLFGVRDQILGGPVSPEATKRQSAAPEPKAQITHAVADDHGVIQLIEMNVDGKKLSLDLLHGSQIYRGRLIYGLHRDGSFEQILVQIHPLTRVIQSISSDHLNGVVYPIRDLKIGGAILNAFPKKGAVFDTQTLGSFTSSMPARSELRRRPLSAETMPLENIAPTITPLKKVRKRSLVARRPSLATRPQIPVTAIHVDAESAENYFEFIRDFLGVKSVLVNGATGEFHKMTPELRREAVEILTQKAKQAGLLVFTNVSGSNFTETEELARLAAANGADGVVIAPLFYSDSQDVFDNVENLSSKINIPIVLYNNPGITKKQNLDPEVVQRLWTRQCIIGIKDSSGDIELFRRYHRNGLPVYAGSEGLFKQALDEDADGGVGSSGNLLRAVQTFIRAKPKNRARYQAELAKYRDALTAKLQNIPGALKYGLSLISVDGEHPLVQPLTLFPELSREDQQAIESVIPKLRRGWKNRGEGVVLLNDPRSELRSAVAEAPVQTEFDLNADGLVLDHGAVSIRLGSVHADNSFVILIKRRDEGQKIQREVKPDEFAGLDLINTPTQVVSITGAHVTGGFLEPKKVRIKLDWLEPVSVMTGGEWGKLQADHKAEDAHLFKDHSFADLLHHWPVISLRQVQGIRKINPHLDFQVADDGNFQAVVNDREIVRLEKISGEKPGIRFVYDFLAGPSHTVNLLAIDFYGTFLEVRQQKTGDNLVQYQASHPLQKIIFHPDGTMEIILTEEAKGILRDVVDSRIFQDAIKTPFSLRTKPSNGTGPRHELRSSSTGNRLFTPAQETLADKFATLINLRMQLNTADPLMSRTEGQHPVIYSSVNESLAELRLASSDALYVLAYHPKVLKTMRERWKGKTHDASSPPVFPQLVSDILDDLVLAHKLTWKDLLDAQAAQEITLHLMRDGLTLGPPLAVLDLKKKIEGLGQKYFSRNAEFVRAKQDLQTIVANVKRSLAAFPNPSQGTSIYDAIAPFPRGQQSMTVRDFLLGNRLVTLTELDDAHLSKMEVFLNEESTRLSLKDLRKRRIGFGDLILVRAIVRNLPDLSTMLLTPAAPPADSADSILHELAMRGEFRLESVLETSAIHGWNQIRDYLEKNRGFPGLELGKIEKLFVGNQGDWEARITRVDAAVNLLVVRNRNNHYPIFITWTGSGTALQWQTLLRDKAKNLITKISHFDILKNPANELLFVVESPLQVDDIVSVRLFSLNLKGLSPLGIGNESGHPENNIFVKPAMDDKPWKLEGNDLVLERLKGREALGRPIYSTYVLDLSQRYQIAKKSDYYVGSYRSENHNEKGHVDGKVSPDELMARRVAQDLRGQGIHVEARGTHVEIAPDFSRDGHDQPKVNGNDAKKGAKVNGEKPRAELRRAEIYKYFTGSFETVKLSTQSGSSFTVTELGANVLDAFLNGKPTLWHKTGGQQLWDAENKAAISGGMPFMFPWSSRIKNGKFRAFDGREIDLRDIHSLFPGLIRWNPDAKAGPNALHGISDKLRWRIVETQAEGDNAHAILELDTGDYEMAEDDPSAPQHRRDLAGLFGRAKIQLIYHLQGNQLSVGVSVTSLEKEHDILIAFGHHPFFMIENRDDWEVLLEAEELWETDGGQVPVKRHRVSEFQQGMDDVNQWVSLAGYGFERSYAKRKSPYTFFRNRKTKEVIRIQQSALYSHTVLWVPKGNPAVISAQPTTSSSDAFNREDGQLVRVSAGDTVSSNWSVSRKTLRQYYVITQGEDQWLHFDRYVSGSRRDQNSMALTNRNAIIRILNETGIHASLGAEPHLIAIDQLDDQGVASALDLTDGGIVLKLQKILDDKMFRMELREEADVTESYVEPQHDTRGYQASFDREWLVIRERSSGKTWHMKRADAQAISSWLVERGIQTHADENSPVLYLLHEVPNGEINLSHDGALDAFQHLLDQKLRLEVRAKSATKRLDSDDLAFLAERDRFVKKMTRALRFMAHSDLDRGYWKHEAKNRLRVLADAQPEDRPSLIQERQIPKLLDNFWWSGLGLDIWKTRTFSAVVPIQNILQRRNGHIWQPVEFDLNHRFRLVESQDRQSFEIFYSENQGKYRRLNDSKPGDLVIIQKYASVLFDLRRWMTTDRQTEVLMIDFPGSKNLSPYEDHGRKIVFPDGRAYWVSADLNSKIGIVETHDVQVVANDFRKFPGVYQSVITNYLSAHRSEMRSDDEDQSKSTHHAFSTDGRGLPAGVPDQYEKGINWRAGNMTTGDESISPDSAGPQPFSDERDEVRTSASVTEVFPSGLDFVVNPETHIVMRYFRAGIAPIRLGIRWIRSYVQSLKTRINELTSVESSASLNFSPAFTSLLNHLPVFKRVIESKTNRQAPGLVFDITDELNLAEVGAVLPYLASHSSFQYVIVTSHNPSEVQKFMDALEKLAVSKLGLTLKQIRNLKIESVHAASFNAVVNQHLDAFKGSAAVIGADQEELENLQTGNRHLLRVRTPNLSHAPEVMALAVVLDRLTQQALEALSRGVQESSNLILANRLDSLISQIRAEVRFLTAA